MSKSPLLSIVIPAYNVEFFLEETVSSVANSRHSNEIEILIVNDGSTDNTKVIAEKLTQKYNCVKVINKTNGGHGSTINAGIKMPQVNIFVSSTATTGLILKNLTNMSNF